ncbi:MAG TPA: hypothetical protein VER96_38485 [Polyangiaceae bacterium]|nr:hypothetical protein [Polyangiaceae bacterium]
MDLRRSVLWGLACALEMTSGVVACGGDAQSPAAAGASSSAGGSNGTAGSGAAHAGAGGVMSHAGGASTATSGGTSGAATGGTATGGAAIGGTGSAQGGSAAGGTGGLATGGAATGGAATGGAANAGTGGSSAGSAGASGCSGLTQTRNARSGKSAGFAGDYTKDYYPLYSHACTTASDCAAACVTAGGTQASCAASECVDSTTDYCLPPTYWVDFDQLLTEGNTQESSTWIIMVNNPYRDQLLASNFQFEIPSGAKILGISFSINEAAGSADMIADYSVRALANGAAVGLDRGHTKAWTTDFHPEIYGGAADLWGATWTPEIVNAAGFGIGLTPLYLDSAGNERAYVDFIRATVTYDVCK